MFFPYSWTTRAFMKSNNLQQNATLEMSVLHVMLKKISFYTKIECYKLMIEIFLMHWNLVFPSIVLNLWFDPLSFNKNWTQLIGYSTLPVFNYHVTHLKTYGGETLYNKIWKIKGINRCSTISVWNIAFPYNNRLNRISRI